MPPTGDSTAPHMAPRLLGDREAPRFPEGLDLLAVDHELPGAADDAFDSGGPASGVATDGRLFTSRVKTGGRLTVCAVPRTHDAASTQSKTALIVHFIGTEPS
jgi:hypothetical protein